MDFIFKMVFNRVLLGLTVFVIVIVNCIAAPGGGHRHVFHRIHVPQQIKTVYHTKIIKVPEHHHHFHEKEKIVIHKEEPKKEHHEYPPSLEDDDNDWQGYESSRVYQKKRYVGPSQTPKRKPKGTKKRRVVRPSYSHYKKRA